MRELQIAEGLSLPLDAATETFGWLGMRGSGKTHGASVTAEEMYSAGIQIAIIDPLGAWYGLKTSADGHSPGLPIAVLGGEHADIPITADMGEQIARFIVERKMSVILDLGLFSKAKQVKFVTDFAEALYQHNRQPLHLFIDEADRFCPQQPMPGEQRMIGAVDDIVRRGRFRGLGVTLITQRIAAINKAVFEQVETIFAMRSAGTRDRKAIKEWMEAHGSEEERDELLASLPSLPTGTAWVASAAWLKIFKKVQIRLRHTFDSSATPKFGEAPRQMPQVQAEINLDALRELLTLPQVEQADDPDVLRAAISELRREIAERPAPQRVEIPVLTDEDRSLLRQAELVLRRIEQCMGHEPSLAPPSHQTASMRLALMDFVPPRNDPPPEAAAVTTSDDLPVKSLKLGERRMLGALASYWPTPITRHQLGVLCEMKSKNSTFSGYLSVLRVRGYITEGDSMVGISDAGLGYLGYGGSSSAMPTRQSAAGLQATWLRHFKEGERKILEALIANYPSAVTRSYLASVAGNLADSTFSGYLSRLRKSELIEEERGLIRAARELFPE